MRWELSVSVCARACCACVLRVRVRVCTRARACVLRVRVRVRVCVPELYVLLLQVTEACCEGKGDEVCPVGADGLPGTPVACDLECALKYVLPPGLPSAGLSCTWNPVLCWLLISGRL